MIATLSGQYRFLSNFWSCFIDYGNIGFPSVENAYQAVKCVHPPDMLKFVDIKASEAKRLGRVIKMRPTWDSEKLEVMHTLVLQKFTEPSLRAMILSTGEQHIEEGNWWGDTFWGTVNGKGENHLGRILMRVRDEVKVIKRAKIVNYQALPGMEPLA